MRASPRGPKPERATKRSIEGPNSALAKAAVRPRAVPKSPSPEKSSDKRLARPSLGLRAPAWTVGLALAPAGGSAAKVTLLGVGGVGTINGSPTPPSPSRPTNYQMLYIHIGFRASLRLHRRIRPSPARAPPNSASDVGSGTRPVS